MFKLPAHSRLHPSPQNSWAHLLGLLLFNIRGVSASNNRKERPFSSRRPDRNRNKWRKRFHSHRTCAEQVKQEASVLCVTLYVGCRLRYQRVSGWLIRSCQEKPESRGIAFAYHIISGTVWLDDGWSRQSHWPDQQLYLLWSFQTASFGTGSYKTRLQQSGNWT